LKICEKLGVVESGCKMSKKGGTNMEESVLNVTFSPRKEISVKESQDFESEMKSSVKINEL